MSSRAARYREEVQVAHWLLSTRDKTSPLAPEQVAFALDQTPRSMGRDLLYVRWWQRGLTVQGGRLFDIYGIPTEVKFGDREQTAYKLTAFMAEQYAEACELEIEPVTCYRISSAVLSEVTSMKVCTVCKTTGCEHCQWLGTMPWTDHRRRVEIDTTQRRWDNPLGNLYRSTLREAVTVERQAALAFTAQIRSLFPGQHAVLLRSFTTGG
jgi:hypothetical protein